MAGAGAKAAIVLALALLSGCQQSQEPAALDPRVEAVVALYRTDGAQRALPEFERLAPAFASAPHGRDATAIVHYLGECHWRLGNFDEARRHLERAVDLVRAAGDRRAESRTLNVVGLLEWDLGRYQEARRAFLDASRLAQELRDRKLQGASLNNLSLVYDELGLYEVSLRQYQQVLKLYEDADFPRGVGDTLGNIGGVHLLLGHFQEALGYYRRALDISRRLESKASMSQDHGNIALALAGLGEVEQALENFDRAIALAREAGMKQDQAYWTGAKANALIQGGRFDTGLELHRAAVAIYEGLGAQAELLEALLDFGRLHLQLGDLDTAQRQFERALGLARSIGLARGITQSLLALGDLERRRNRPDPALRHFAEAGQRAAESGEQHLLAESLLHLAFVHRGRRQLDLAEQESRRALDVARAMEARPVEAEAQLAVAEVERLRGRRQAALEAYAAAEAAYVDNLDPDVAWQVHFGRALVHEAGGGTAAAIDELLAAVAVIESVRSRLREERFRNGYVQDKYEVYVELARLQLGEGRAADAFSTAERLRARSFAEQLHRRLAPDLSDAERKTEARLRERVRQLQRALGSEGVDGRRQAVAVFSKELVAAEREYQAFLDRHSASNQATGDDGPALSAADVQGRLEPHAAVFEYIVGRERTIAFLLTAQAVTARVVPIGQPELAARIALLRDLLRKPGDDRWRRPAARIASDLIEPLTRAGALEGLQHVYVVPHGALNYVPFALLPRPDGRLLVDDLTLSYLPTATALAHGTGATRNSHRMLTVAPARSRLRHAPDEARQIDALFQPGSTLLAGTRATESRFKALAADFDMLHIATHGRFNRLNPLLSGIELEADAADDGFLQVHEVLRLRLDADLVTLSACDTALGSGYFTETPAGDELVGMTRAFLAAGSASVLATLWEVDDAASVRFMQGFYAGLDQRSGHHKAQALARAQRAMRASRDLSHPYYWAPFVLVGAPGPSSADRHTLVARQGDGQP